MVYCVCVDVKISTLSFSESFNADTLTIMNFTDRLKFAIGFSRIDRLMAYRRYLDGYQKHLEEFTRIGDQRKCALIGTANYGNIGDMAITEAELAFLKEYFKGRTVEVPTMDFLDYERDLRKFLNPQDLLCFQGGGNMGDMYQWFEFERCQVLECFPKQASIIMPQTFFYKDQDSPWLRYSKKTYAKCKDLHLFAREGRSERLMKEAYPQNQISLVPDIVLSLDVKPYVRGDITRDGLLMVLRQDEERALSEEDWTTIHALVEHEGMTVTERDTILDVDKVTPEERFDIVSNMLMAFASAEVAVTDRLHGMIFAAITGTPCVAFANTTYKVEGVYQWIKDLPYVEFVKDPKDLRPALQRVRKVEAIYPRGEMLKKFQPLIDALK